MNLWSVEHFFDIFFTKTRFSCNQNIGEVYIDSPLIKTLEREDIILMKKNVEEMFNRSEVHLENKYYL